MARVIDVHAHYFPQKVLKELGQKWPQLKLRIARSGSNTEIRVGSFRHYGRVDPGIFGIEKTLVAMDRQGIKKRILSLTPFTLFYEFGEKLAIEVTRRCNDFAAALAEKYPERITCMAVVPLQSPEASDELKRATKDLGLVGVEIGSNVAGRNLDEPAFRPFFAAANRLGTPVFIHPIYVAAVERLRNYYFSNLVGNPIDTTIAAASLICGGVLKDFASLNVILAHAGGFLPFQIGRLDRGYRVRKETRAVIKKPPSEYFRRLYFDTITHNQAALSFLIQSIGAEHVLMGSDYPFDMGYADPRGVITSLGQTGEVRDLILGKNAERLFG